MITTQKILSENKISYTGMKKVEERKLNMGCVCKWKRHNQRQNLRQNFMHYTSNSEGFLLETSVMNTKLWWYNRGRGSREL